MVAARKVRQCHTQINFTDYGLFSDYTIHMSAIVCEIKQVLVNVSALQWIRIYSVAVIFSL